MAFDPTTMLSADSAADEALAAPLAGTRKQRLQRLQVGMFGLGTMVLMVGLANLIISSAQQNQIASPEELPPVTNADVPPPPPAPRDPLADAGVVPELPTDPDAATGPANPMEGEAGNGAPPAQQN